MRLSIESEQIDLIENTATIAIRAEMDGTSSRIAIVVPIPDGNDRSEDEMCEHAREAAARLLKNAQALFERELNGGLH